MKRLIQIINLLFIAIVFGAILLDSFFHPQAFVNKFGIDSKVLLLGYILFVTAIKLRFSNIFPKATTAINNKYLFPLLLLIFFVMVFLENTMYMNYTLEHFHLHHEEFAFLVIVSGLVGYYGIDWSSYSSIQKLLYLLAPLFIGFMGYVDVSNPSIVRSLSSEDGIIEYLQFLLFLISAVLSIITVALLFKKQKITALFLSGLALMLFFVAFEEISWGQRILNIETPESLEQINWQNETTIHNIGTFQKYIYIPYICIALWGVWGRKILRFVKVFPNKSINYLAPGSHLLIYFATVGIYYFSSEAFRIYYQPITNTRIAVMRWQEISELLLAVGFLVYAIENYMVAKSQRS